MDGHLVNQAARQALGAKLLWPSTKDTPAETVAAALDLIASDPDTPVVELPLVRDGLYSRLDALVPVEGGWALQETKSSTFPLKTDKVTPAKVDAHLIDDVAIQAWVAEESKLPIVRVELNLLNSRWTYLGEDDYNGLFRLRCLDEEVAELKPQVVIWLKEANEVLKGDMPETTTSKHCSKPYDCQFEEHCKSLEPAPEAHPIELLPDLAGKNLAAKIKAENGFTSLVGTPHELLVGKARPMYLRMQKAHTTGKPVLEKSIKDVLEALPYPRYFFDFEGIDLPVPRWSGVRPYEQIPFQWSCHVETEPGVFKHYAFLDLSGKDPSLGCIERMREVIDENDNGPILVYYQTYEKGRLQELGVRHPEFYDLTEKYISRLVDLHPMVKEHYYHPGMKGSFSIKKVLPTIAPELSYDDLEMVQEGTGAQIAYLNACFSNLGKRVRYELAKNMLAYCEQDTWAMVVVAYFLEGGRKVPLVPAPDMSPMAPLAYRMTETEQRQAEEAALT